MKLKAAGITALALTGLQSTAFAGSSATSLACSSKSGRTVISGFLPGQGEEEIRLNVSVAHNIMVYKNADEGKTTAKVNLDARKKSVSIEVSNADLKTVLKSKAPATTKLVQSGNGTGGTFIGLLSGTHPSTFNEIPTPIEVRCYVSDEI